MLFGDSSGIARCGGGDPDATGTWNDTDAVSRSGTWPSLWYFGAAIGLGTAFGPTLGGLFLGSFGSELGWRWTFGMNVPLALVIIPLALWLIPRLSPRQALPI